MKIKDSCCKNCGHPLFYHEKFCPYCGQNAETRRIDSVFFLNEVRRGFFRLDEGISYTLKQLFTRPGHSIREYLEGKRQRHYRLVPLIMVLGMATLLLNKWINGDSLILTTTLVLDGESNPDDPKDVRLYEIAKSLTETYSETINWINEHFAFALLLMIPVFAFSFWVVFKKSNLNFGEWMVISAFSFAQGMVVYFFLIFLDKIFPYVPLLFLLIMTGITMWTMLQMFHTEKKTKVIYRTLLSFLIYYFSFFLLFVLSIVLISLTN